MQILKPLKDKEIKIMVILLIIVLVTVLIAAIFFVLYNKRDNEIVEKSAIGTNNQYYQETEDERARSSELASILKNRLPKIDGDISTISLEAGIIAKLAEIDIEIAEKNIVHTTEEKAFKNLLSGECDLIFTTNFTINQEREAAAKNIDLTKEVIAQEALVFVVNSANPVESLTQEQLKDIFAGKITNWSEVGGNDAEIIVYQNAEDTMAQKFMEIFMDDTQLATPKTEFLPASNSGLIETTATYDNDENAIGFMLYKYSNNMYGNGNEIKFLKVDEIEVTKQTLASHQYLLLYDIYAVYNTANAERKMTKNLVEWILTSDGQKAISEAGYIPLKAIQVEEISANKYNSLGTGKEQTEQYGSCYYTVNYTEYCEINETEKIESIKGLQNQELEENINKFIQESIQKLQTVEKEYEQYLSQKTNSVVEGINIQTQCKNGYLCVQILLTYQIGTIDYIYDGYSKVYDLYTGTELQLSDLYYMNSDFVTVLNKQIETLIVEKKGIDINNVQMKRPFIGITDNILYGLDMIIFKKDNPYFVEGEIFELDTYFENILIANEERNMQDIWEENVKIEKKLVSHELNGSSLQRGNVEIRTIGNCIYNVFYINTNNDEYDAKINEKINQYVDNDRIARLIQNVQTNNPNANFITNTKNQYQITISINILGNKYAIMNIAANRKINEISLGYSITDLETGETASQADVQKWRTENGV